jgi:glycosyltransferase involved in cell wall biosynthesis
MKVLNITPHLGGGVGTSIEDYIRQSHSLGVENSIFCLDSCIQKPELGSIPTSFIEDVFWGDRQLLLEEIVMCDVVLVHYWNHPLLTVFLSETKLPKSKLVFWCHNSGLFEPHIIPNYVASIASKVVFSSAISTNAYNFDYLDSVGISRCATVPTVRNLDAFFEIGAARVEKKLILNLVYVGTVSKSKMHPDSALIFSELSRHGFSVKVVGGPDHEILDAEVRALGGKVEIFGKEKEVLNFYESADLFIYPLRPDHYGTGEQVLLEAMASGLPVVAFNNPAERAILSQFKGSRLVGSVDEFLSSVVNLTGDPQNLFSISQEVFSKAQSVFKPGIMAREMMKHLEQVSSSGHHETLELTSKNVNNILAIYARSSFYDESFYVHALEELSKSIGLMTSKVTKELLEPGGIEKWFALDKSTPWQYLRYFPNDIGLALLVKELERVRSQL